MKKRYKVLIFLVIILSIASYVLLIHVLPYAIIKPPRITAVNYLDNHNIDYEEINVVSFDSTQLNGIYVKSILNKPKASIVLVHGIGGCKEHFTNLASNLSKRGFDCWLFDNRAHGKSSGLYTTYGYLEKKDIKEIIDLIKKRTPDVKVGIWGNSLGGAIAVQALEYDKRISFGVIESSFANLRQIVYDYQKRMSYDIGLKFAANIALNEAGNIAKFHPDEVSPINSAKQINQPVLICHGDKDENINIEYGKALFKSFASRDKEMIVVKDGGHFGLFATGGETYENKILSFLDKKSDK